MHLCDWKGCLVVDVEPCGSSVCNVCIQNVSLFSRPIMSAVGTWGFFWCDFCVADDVPGEVNMLGNSVVSIVVNVESVCGTPFA